MEGVNMKVILDQNETKIDSSIKQFLCGPCAHYGGCRP